MKALIRNKGETLLESYNVPGINWKNGYPLTSSGWSGGSYFLVDDYVPQVDAPKNHEEVEVEPEQVVIEENENDYVVIDGKRYSKEELRKLLE